MATQRLPGVPLSAAAPSPLLTPEAQAQMLLESTFLHGSHGNIRYTVRSHSGRTHAHAHRQPGASLLWLYRSQRAARRTKRLEHPPLPRLLRHQLRPLFACTRMHTRTLTHSHTHTPRATQPFALAPLIEETVELLAPRAQAKNIEIASFVDDRLPERIVGDAARLRQVLLNLAGNAIKFTANGGVAVIVEPAGDDIRFLVHDTGIGLAPEDQARIFRDFEQADGSSTRKFGGTGLGLAISKRIVERMDGDIAVDSEAGKGATFSVTLPLLPAVDGAPDFSAPDLAGKAVLIVAATDVLSASLARRLGRWGAATTVATDAQSADALLAKPDWHSVLVDYPLARTMIGHGDLARSAGTRRIVLIRPTERHELPSLKAAGFTGYLIKPVRVASLAARLTAEAVFEDMPAEISGGVAAAPAGKGLAILVAEDNEINALLARALLTRLGHRPTIAGDGETAVASWTAARAAGQPYDLVLMDVQMPGMDGLEAARRIRAAEAQAGDRPTRILALTANAQAEDRAECLAAGMDGLLVKPLDRERLREALELVAARIAA